LAEGQCRPAENGAQVNFNLGLDEQRQINFLVNLVKQLHAQAQGEGDPISVEGVLDQVIAWEWEFQEKDLKSAQAGRVAAVE